MTIDREKSPFYEQITKIVSPDQVIFDEPLSKHTSFKIGGPADYYIEIKEANELAELIHYFSLIEKEYYVLGNGSNVLVGDKGYRGVILSVHKHMSDIVVEGDRIICGAGATLSSVASSALKASLTGFEFAAGIPGTVGGALVMNAGAYGGEISQVMESAEVVAANGNILTLRNDEMMFGYRTSVFKKEQLVCTKAVFKLSEGNPDDIKAKMDDLRVQRVSKQPINYPSAGSTFKRPEGYFAGKLIMDAGLRGLRIGDAQVSEKHCGFIVNVGNATAADVKDLIEEVTDRVKQCYGVKLEPEVCMLGEF